MDSDTLTRVTKYTLVRNGRMLHIDVHERISGHLAAPFIAVPNLLTIVAPPELQGTGETEELALKDCLHKIEDMDMEAIFPNNTPGNG